MDVVRKERRMIEEVVNATSRRDNVRRIGLNTPEQEEEDKPWRNEALQSQEEQCWVPRG